MKEFPCTKCGACCKLIPNHVLEFYKLPKAETGGCGHLKDDNSCSIYDTRPDICSVQKTWKKVHSKKLSWDEYISYSVKACEILQSSLEKQKK